MEEKLLNEERYARAIAGGKFRQKGWGRRKIANRLKSKGVNEKLINISLKEIDEKDYERRLLQILDKKKSSLQGRHPAVIKQKLMRYAISRGYETELVYMMMEKILGMDTGDEI
jgi:regulatory protein